MSRYRSDALLLGEWACLGVLCAAPAHGFAVAARMAPSGDIGRAWALSRALTYRALDRLAEFGFIHVVGEEPGRAGGTRTILAPTRAGRAALRGWVATPVEHLRDVRSELVVKLLIGATCAIDTDQMLVAQRLQISAMVEVIEQDADEHPTDVVSAWRAASSSAALRFVERELHGRGL